MPVSKAIRHLLRIRQIGEDNARAELESAVAELNARETALMRNMARARDGRRLVAESVASANQDNRIVGMNEQVIAAQHANSLQRRVDDARGRAEALRQEYLVARTNRRQAEVLIENAAAQDELDLRRHAQQDLDTWHRDRSRRGGK